MSTNDDLFFLDIIDASHNVTCCGLNSLRLDIQFKERTRVLRNAISDFFCTIHRRNIEIAINNERINIDRTFYFMSDMENFIPLSGEAANRFSSKTRFRFGFGYRFSYTWRAEFLYLVDKGRDTLEEEFDVTAEAVNFRVKINF